MSLLDQFANARLDDGAVTRLELFDFRRTEIDAYDAITLGSEASGRYRADITQAKYADIPAHAVLRGAPRAGMPPAGQISPKRAQILGYSSHAAGSCPFSVQPVARFCKPRKLAGSDRNG